MYTWISWLIILFFPHCNKNRLFIGWLIYGLYDIYDFYLRFCLFICFLYRHGEQPFIYHSVRSIYQKYEKYTLLFAMLNLTTTHEAKMGRHVHAFIRKGFLLINFIGYNFCHDGDSSFKTRHSLRMNWNWKFLQSHTCIINMRIKKEITARL